MRWSDYTLPIYTFAIWSLDARAANRSRFHARARGDPPGVAELTLPHLTLGLARDAVLAGRRTETWSAIWQSHPILGPSGGTVGLGRPSPPAVEVYIESVPIPQNPTI